MRESAFFWKLAICGCGQVLRYTAHFRMFEHMAAENGRPSFEPHRQIHMIATLNTKCAAGSDTCSGTSSTLAHVVTLCADVCELCTATC